MHVRDPRLRLGLAIIAYLVAYVVLDWLSYVQPVLKLGITPWNPQAGLTLAFMVLAGPRAAPLVAIGALSAELLVRDNPAPLHVLLMSSSWIAVGYGIASHVLRTRLKDLSVQTPADAAITIAVSAGVTLAVAAGYALIYTAGGWLPRAALPTAIARYWVGDLNGILTLFPLLLSWRRFRDGLVLVRSRLTEATAQLLAVVIIVWLIFGISGTDELQFFYVLFVPVVWVALRWGLTGATLAVLAAQVSLIIAVKSVSRFSPLLDVQFLMITLGVTALMLGAAVTQRSAALRRVAAREAEQRVLLSTAPDAILTVTPTAVVLSANAAATELLELPEAELVGSSLDRFLPALPLADARGRSEAMVRSAQLRVFPAEVTWARLERPAAPGAVLVVRDVTERHETASRLRDRDIALARAMRFASAGELASALAHELNQPITAIVSYLKAAELMAAQGSGGDSRLPDTLAKASREGHRAADVIKRLRDFYRGGMPKLEPTDLHDVFRWLADTFATRLQRAGAELRTAITADLPLIMTDKAHLEVALHNIVANALDSIESGSPERRIVQLRARPLGDLVEVFVDDSGPGIASEIREELFEPFLTTKHDGMGLGLAISRSLIQAQGGDLRLDSSELGGARFRITLPATSGTHGTTHE